MTSIFVYIFLFITIFLGQIDGNIQNPRSLCVRTTCQREVLARNQHPVSSCEDCRMNNTRFCGEISGKIYCFHRIPEYCQELTNKAKTEVEQVHQYCYLPNSFFLEAPIVRFDEDKAINFAIPRFFEEREYEEYGFSNLTLFVKHDAKSSSDCTTKFFTTHYSSIPPYCLLIIPTSLPKFDSNAGNDQYYYDDQTDMSVEFSRDVLKTPQNSTISTWFSVQAMKSVPHENATLKFEFPMYSYRKDVRI